MGQSLAQINIRFKADLKEFSTQMQTATRGLKRFGNDLKRTGTALSLGLTAPIVALGVKSVKTFADFEDGLAKVAAVSGASASEMEQLRQNAEDLGAATRFTASQVAELQLSLSKLGFDPSEILAATEGVLNLALATGEDLATSATVAAATLRGFNLDVAETDRVVDVMASSFSSSALDLDKFSTAMATVAPVAASAGQSIENTTGLLAVLVNAGIDASTAGTSLRNIFLTLAKTGQTLEEALSEISSSSNANAKALDLFGKRGATVATVLAKNIDQAKDFAAEFKNAGGSASAMAKIMDDTAKGSLARLRSAVESAFIAIGDELAPTIRDLADRLSGLISKFKDLSPETKRAITVIGGLAAVVGPLLTAIGFMATNVVPGLISSFVRLRAATIALNSALLSNPFTAVALGIGLVITALISLNRQTDVAVKKQSQLDQVRAQASKSIAAEKTKLEELLFIARDENVSKAQRIKAVKELNGLNRKYLGDLTLETINTDKAREAIEKYNDELLRTATIKAAQEKLTEIISRIVDLELTASKNRKAALEDETLALRQQALASNQGLSAEEARLKFLDAINKGTQVRIAGLQEEAKQLLDIITKNQTLTDTLKDQGDQAGGTSGQIRNTFASLRGEVEAFTSSVTTDAAAALVLLQKRGLEATAGLNKLAKPLTDLEAKMKITANRINEQVGPVIQDAAATIVSGMGGVIAAFALGSDGFSALANLMLGTLGDLMIRLGEIAIQTAIGLTAIEAAFANINPVIAAAAGVALIAFGSIIKGSIQQAPAQVALAQGGLAFGPTLALVGDNRGAAFDPEVIAPVSKLQQFIDSDNGAPVDVNVTIDGEVRGDRMRLVLDRTDIKRGRRS